MGILVQKLKSVTLGGRKTIGLIRQIGLIGGKNVGDKRPFYQSNRGLSGQFVLLKEFLLSR